MIHLVGPGGAGKSTVAPLLAAALGMRSADLDARFTAARGCVDAFLAAHGYRAYAAANVAAYLDLAAGDAGGDEAPVGVVALSSGFMTYPPDVHPRYAALRDALAAAPTTVVLLPALGLEACVAETVRRQVGQPGGGADERGAGRGQDPRALRALPGAAGAQGDDHAASRGSGEDDCHPPAQPSRPLTALSIAQTRLQNVGAPPQLSVVDEHLCVHLCVAVRGARTAPRVVRV